MAGPKLSQDSPAKCLLQIFQAMYYIISKGISKHNFFSLDLHLLFKRGRLAAKSLKRLTHHHSQTGHARNYISALSCRYMDPTEVYVPREVEFSCSNTPSFPFYNKKQRPLFGRNNHSGCRYESNDSEVFNGKRIFELLDMKEYYSDEDDEVSVVGESPSPWISLRTPVGVRQLRVSDSPFLNEEMEMKEKNGVDLKAEEFITWFRDQLKEQQLSSGTSFEKRKCLK